MAPAPTAFRLPHTILAGSSQMAVDAGLLRWAASGPARLAARTYGWERPTLSLGRSEPFPEGWDEDSLRAAGVDVVRRPTGGGAVLHDDEVTFAVAASLPGPWAAGPRALALAVAGALADALRSLGVPAAVVSSSTMAPAGPVPRGASASGRGHPCFARICPGEVRADGHKVAGIASRFTRGAALSHASVPLSSRHRDVARFRLDAARAESDLLARARSIGEILGRRAAPDAVEAALFEALALHLRVRFAERVPDAADACCAVQP